MLKMVKIVSDIINGLRGPYRSEVEEVSLHCILAAAKELRAKSVLVKDPSALTSIILERYTNLSVTHHRLQIIVDEQEKELDEHIIPKPLREKIFDAFIEVKNAKLEAEYKHRILQVLEALNKFKDKLGKTELNLEEFKNNNAKPYEYKIFNEIEEVNSYQRLLDYLITEKLIDNSIAKELDISWLEEQTNALRREIEQHIDSNPKLNPKLSAEEQEVKFSKHEKKSKELDTALEITEKQFETQLETNKQLNEKAIKTLISLKKIDIFEQMEGEGLSQDRKSKIHKYLLSQDDNYFKTGSDPINDNSSQSERFWTSISQDIVSSISRLLNDYGAIFTALTDVQLAQIMGYLAGHENSEISGVIANYLRNYGEDLAPFYKFDKTFECMVFDRAVVNSKKLIEMEDSNENKILCDHFDLWCLIADEMYRFGFHAEAQYQEALIDLLDSELSLTETIDELIENSGYYGCIDFKADPDFHETKYALDELLINFEASNNALTSNEQTIVKQAFEDILGNISKFGDLSVSKSQRLVHMELKQGITDAFVNKECVVEGFSKQFISENYDAFKGLTRLSNRDDFEHNVISAILLRRFFIPKTPYRIITRQSISKQQNYKIIKETILKIETLINSARTNPEPNSFNIEKEELEQLINNVTSVIESENINKDEQNLLKSYTNWLIELVRAYNAIFELRLEAKQSFDLEYWNEANFEDFKILIGLFQESHLDKYLQQFKLKIQHYLTDGTSVEKSLKKKWFKELVTKKDLSDVLNVETVNTELFRDKLQHKLPIFSKTEIFDRIKPKYLNKLANAYYAFNQPHKDELFEHIKVEMFNWYLGKSTEVTSKLMVGATTDECIAVVFQFLSNVANELIKELPEIQAKNLTDTKSDYFEKLDRLTAQVTEQKLLDQFEQWRIAAKNDNLTTTCEQILSSIEPQKELQKYLSSLIDYDSCEEIIYRNCVSNKKDFNDLLAIATTKYIDTISLQGHEVLKEELLDLSDRFFLMHSVSATNKLYKKINNKTYLLVKKNLFLNEIGVKAKNNTTIEAWELFRNAFIDIMTDFSSYLVISGSRTFSNTVFYKYDYKIQDFLKLKQNEFLANRTVQLSDENQPDNTVWNEIYKFTMEYEYSVDEWQQYMTDFIKNADNVPNKYQLTPVEKEVLCASWKYPREPDVDVIWILNVKREKALSPQNYSQVLGRARSKFSKYYESKSAKNKIIE